MKRLQVTDHGAETMRAFSWLKSFAVIGNALMRDEGSDTWTALIKVPHFEPDDEPVLVAFMHTDEPQCAM